jgi:hypothetical protein
MGASFVTLEEIAIEIYNVSRSDLALGALAPATDQEWAKAGELKRLLVLSDVDVAKLISKDRSNGSRPALPTVTQTGIAHGGQLQQSSGPLDTVQFAVTGGRWAGTHPFGVPRGDNLEQKIQELQIQNRNVTANPEIPPQGLIDGETVYHNAAGLVLGGASSVSVNARFFRITINFSATNTICPDEYARVIAVGALAKAFVKDGHKSEAAGYFEGIYQAERQLVGLQVAQ